MKTINIIIGLVIMVMFSGCTNLSVSGIPTFNNDTTIINEEYRYAVASGKVNSAQVWNKFGYNQDIDTTTDPEIIASFGGSPDFFLTTAETLNISSTDADDTSGGTGARSVVITGVNNNWEEIIDVVTLNGTNVVQSNLQFIGVNRMAIFQSGSSLSNEGDITAVASSSASTQAQIPTESGTTQQALFYVETNHTFLTTDLTINVNKLSGGSTPTVTILGYSYVPLTNARYEVFRYVLDTTIREDYDFHPTMPFVIGEEQILYFVAETDTSNTIVNMRFSGILEQDIS